VKSPRCLPAVFVHLYLLGLWHHLPVCVSPLMFVRWFLTLLSVCLCFSPNSSLFPYFQCSMYLLHLRSSKIMCGHTLIQGKLQNVHDKKMGYDDNMEVKAPVKRLLVSILI
jgi:hypothetical protein